MNDFYKKSFPPLTTEAELNISASQLSFGDKAQGPFPVEKVVLPPKFSLKSSETPAKLNAKQQDAFKLVPPADFRKAAKKKPSKVVPVKAQWKEVKRAKAAKEPVKEAKGGKQAAPSLQRESKAAALESALQASFLEAGSLGKKLLSSSRAKSVFQGKRKADEVKREAEEKKRKAALAQFQAVLESAEVSLKARRKARKRAKQAKKRFKREKEPAPAAAKFLPLPDDDEAPTYAPL
ncbi:hypothetical protein TrCOL_g1250, partial [Triparma columacea]